MRVDTEFKRIMDLPGLAVANVDFESARGVVTVELRNRKLACPDWVHRQGPLRHPLTIVSGPWEVGILQVGNSGGAGMAYPPCSSGWRGGCCHRCRRRVKLLGDLWLDRWFVRWVRSSAHRWSRIDALSISAGGAWR